MKTLITFITAGDPSLAITKQLVVALEKGGADLIELGVPFSDPMADGPIIQRASERSLTQGTSLKDVLKLVREIRKTSRIPLLLMGYYNPIFSYGLKKFSKEAAKVGVNALIVVDLPPEESVDLDRELKKNKIDLIYLLAPTSDSARIRLVAKKARGFIYFVSMTGVTGAVLKSEEEISKKIREIRKQTQLPIVIGFGISKPEQARRMSKIGDGVVVGSALVSLIEKKSSSKLLLPKVESFVRCMKEACEQVY